MVGTPVPLPQMVGSSATVQMVGSPADSKVAARLATEGMPAKAAVAVAAMRVGRPVDAAMAARVVVWVMLGHYL